MTTDGEDRGPWVSAFVPCVLALREESEQLSVIRVIDQIIRTAPHDHPETLVPFDHRFTLLVILTPALRAAQLEPSILLEEPDEDGRLLVQSDVEFQDDGRSANLIVDANIRFKKLGRHWFNLRLDRRVVARASIDVVHHQDVTRGGATE